MGELLETLRNIEKLLCRQNILSKDVYDLQEAALYLNLSEGHLYRLTCTGAIPTYRPNGGKIYFKRVDLDAWLIHKKNEPKNKKERVEKKVNEFFSQKTKRIIQ
jgi:excisionase family DNA binding protein